MRRIVFATFIICEFIYIYLMSDNLLKVVMGQNKEIHVKIIKLAEFTFPPQLHFDLSFEWRKAFIFITILKK